MNYILGPLRKYADFTGRANRAEFWVFALFFSAITVAAHYADQLRGDFKPIAAGMGLFDLSIFLVLLLPFVSVAVRRLHDSNRSGWWTMFLYLPYIGFLQAQRYGSRELLVGAAMAFLMGTLVFAINLSLRGDVSENRFGAPPA